MDAEYFSIKFRPSFAVLQSALCTWINPHLVGAGWLIYRRLPATSAEPGNRAHQPLFRSLFAVAESFGSPLDVPVSLYRLT